MVLELAMFVGGLAGVVAVGTPVVAALGRPQRWAWSSSAPVESGGPRRSGHTTVFTPLDLGPDPIRWPSQREWPSSAVSQPTWPSQNWNDEHFGSHWREGRTGEVQDLGFHAMAGRRFDGAVDDAEAARRHEEANRRRQEALRRQQQQQQQQEQARADERERALQRQRAMSQREPQQRSSEVARQRQQQIALEQMRQQAQADTPPQPPPRQARDLDQAPRPQPQRAVPQVQPPSRDELEALIAKVGLAGTVQSIMDRTGWDFRRAAHYLAKIRQGG
jgi:hypothetical protein